MPKAYSYIRFSSVKQQKGDSVERQTRLSETYAAKHGLELDTDLNMRDLGISAFDGSNLKKGALGQFLRLVEEGRIPRGSYLLVESLDRLSRDKVMDALSIFTDILRAGIIIVTLSDEQVYSYEKSNENWSSLIISIVIMSRANEESAIKSMRLRSSWDAKRLNIENKRLTARCPYWLKPAEGDKGFEFIPDRVAVVRRIFQLSRDGVGNATIVKTLNAETVPLFSQKAKGWHESYIQKIIASPAVYGELHLNLQRDGEMTPIDVIPDYYPAIMSKEEWLIAASTRAGRRTCGGFRKGKNLSNLFSGLIHCGYCGGSMNMGGHVKKRPSGEKIESKYVACSNARRGLGCNFIQWAYPDLERLILRFCKTVDLGQVLGVNKNAEADLNKALIKLEGIKQEILDVRARNESLLDTLEKLGEDATPQPVIDRMIANEVKLDNLLVAQTLASDEVIRLKNMVVDTAVQQSLIVELLQKLETLEGNELHLLRIRLSEAVRRVITKIVTFPGGRWYTEEDIETYRRDLIASDEFDDAAVSEMCAKLDAKPNKKNRLLMLEFQNGEHRTVMSSGRVLDQKTSPPSEWDINTLFDSLEFKVFKRVEA
ncbi:recombinase family protein [Sulfuriferula sp.]|uniref:recombinase family protein n=1 Tax=Sulfuriferula sp. TaxID=2025307 RepID=UPI00273189CB|nr:recombinase family protein [Sulfuriferula sp.]MDP2025630.1 recombinase family protein [Sulfuriferula sp.]